MIKENKIITEVLKRITSPIFISTLLFLFFQLQIFNLSVNIADEGFFLYSAKQITLGQIPYRDFFMHVTPGNYYLLAFLFKIFGTHILIDRILYIVYVIFLLITLSKMFNLRKIWAYFYLFIIVFLQITPSMFFSYNSAYGIAIFSFFFLQRGFKNGKWGYIFFAGLTSGLAFIFKQNVGLFIALSFYILLLLLPEIKNRKKLIFSYSLGFISITSSMFFYFWINDALRQLIQSTLFFAQEFKSANISFVIHRLFFIPLFLLVLISFKYLNKRTKFLFLAIMPFFVILYILNDLSRIGRIIDYLQDNIFYVQTFLYITPLMLISRYVNKIKRTQIDNDCLLYSVLLLTIFFMNTLEGYSSGVITLANIFLIPVVIIILEKFYITRFIVIGIIILISFPFLYNPLKPYALHVGNYPLNTITEYSSIPAAKYIKFNPQEKKEILQIVSNINRYTERNERILCFPYCPMIYILSDRQGATYYGIFGLTYDQKLIISQIIEDNPKIIIVIKQGNFILSPSLETSNLKKIYEYIRKNYQKVSETNNFIVYKIIN